MKLDIQNLQDRARHALHIARKYAVALFLLFLLVIYSYLGWRVVSLDQIKPDQSAVSSKLQTAGVPHIDQDALNKIQQLQDNSVQVQTLFDQARSNPFQE
jgi:predicted negative regulator of RcsB-dependent stress response